MTETVSWMVVEEGVHKLSNGVLIQAGSQDITTAFSDIVFAQNFATPPVVVSQVDIVHDAKAVITRIKAVTEHGFQIRLQGEKKDQSHVPETLNWIAIENGVGNIDSNTFFDVNVKNNLHHEFKKHNFRGAAQDSEPLCVLADQQTYNGGDPAGLRYKSLKKGSIKLRIEEDESTGDGQAHTNEDIGVIAFWSKNDPVLYGTDMTPESIKEPVIGEYGSVTSAQSNRD